MAEAAVRVGLVLGGADELDGLVERIEDDREALQDVDPLLQRAELVLQPPGDHLEAEVEEVAERRPQVHLLGRGDLRVVGRHERRHVDVEARLERRVLKEVGHRRLRARPALQLQYDPDVLRRLVADVDDLGHLPRADVVGDLLDQVALLDGVRDRGQDDGPLALHLVLAAEVDGPLAGLVDLGQFLGRVEDAPAGREVGALDRGQQRLQAGVGALDERQAGVDHLAQVVRWHVRRHPDRDAGRPVDQEVGDRRGEHDRLEELAVVGRPEGDGVLLDLAKQLGTEGLQPRLGVAHGRGAVAVERAEVALTVDERRAERPALSHPHHGVVDGRVAVGVVLAHHLTDDGGALAEARVWLEPEVGRHRVEDATLDRLEAVAHVGQRAARDDREGVGQVPLAGRLVERDRVDDGHSSMSGGMAQGSVRR